MEQILLLKDYKEYKAGDLLYLTNKEIKEMNKELKEYKNKMMSNNYKNK